MIVEDEGREPFDRNVSAQQAHDLVGLNEQFVENRARLARCAEPPG